MSIIFDKKTMVSACRLILPISFLFLTSYMDVFGQVPKLSPQDSLYSIYNDDNVPVTARRDAFYELIWNHHLFSNPDTAGVLAKELFDFCVRHNDQKGKLKATNTRAISYAIRGDYESAEVFFKENLKDAKEAMDYDMVSQSYANIGNCKLEQKFTYSSFDYFNKSIQVLEGIIDTCTNPKDKQAYERNLIISYDNLLSVYIGLEEYEKASKLTGKYEQLFREVSERYSYTRMFLNLADLEFKIGNPKKAKSYIFNDVLRNGNKDDVLTIASGNSLLGEIYQEEGNIDSSQYYFKKAFEDFSQLDFKKGIASTLNQLGGNNLRMKNYTKASNQFQKAQKLAIDHALTSELLSNYKLLAEFNTQRKNYYEALRYNNLYQTLNDSIKQVQEEDLLLSIEDKYNYESEIEENEMNLAIEQEKNKTTRNILYMALFVLALLLLSSVLFYRVNKKLKISEQSLFQKTKLLEEQKIKREELITKLNRHRKIVKSQNVELQRSNEYLESFAYQAAHDIKAPLNTISGFNDVIYNKYKNAIKKEDHALFDFIRKSAGELTNLTDDLLSFASITKNLKPPVLIDLKEELQTIFDLFVSNQERKDITIDTLDAEIQLMVNESLIKQLFMNLISNSIKFSKKDEPNHIKIKCKDVENDFLEIEISDTGVGISENMKDGIFNMFNKYYDKGISDNQSGSGIGLATCKRIVEFLGGEIYANSDYGKGTVIGFTIKVHSTKNGVYEVQS